MENVREVVRENLINLRKEHNLTQIELSKKINYSDKAISRWENGEVLPDIEILQTLSHIYGVTISYLFEEHHELKFHKKQLGNRLAFEFLVVCVIWTILTIAFSYIQFNSGIIAYTLFVWGVPVSCLVVLFFNNKWERNKKVSIITQSILCWSTITAFYLQFLSLNLWLIYIIGIPIQACIIVASYIKFSK